MCACVPPNLWPLVLIAAILVALGVVGWLNTIITAVVAFVASVAATAVAVKVAGILIGNWLDRRSDRRWNAQVAEFHRRRLPRPRGRVDVTVVRPATRAVEPAAPLAIDPASVRVYATPRQELTRGVPR